MTKSVKFEVRNHNIDVARVILMMFIIMHHCIINGYGLQNELKIDDIKNENYTTF